MGKMILGTMILGFGIILTFVPPFFFGPLLIIGGFAMMFRGGFSMTKDAAKATAAGVKVVQNHSREQELARRERELAEREQALAQQPPKPGS
ncbi:hypothetical protein [Bradyrhizobium sp. sGM-13]|uniref:hypothetical protein n=1 Tax=Bradyrhizobium sp. sGM-13 TaxID=2831781 RepID=UPI001BD1B1D5|nr:hypothetical protein [Bradyrhizobium sp. sGM-13]